MLTVVRLCPISRGEKSGVDRQEDTARQRAGHMAGGGSLAHQNNNQQVTQSQTFLFIVLLSSQTAVLELETRWECDGLAWTRYQSRCGLSGVGESEIRTQSHWLGETRQSPNSQHLH